MYYSNEVISYLQANKILALKLDHAVSAVGEQVRNQVDTLGKGRPACCITRPVSPMNITMFANSKGRKICAFRNAVIRIIQHGDVVYEMLRIYFEEIFKYKTNAQLEHIKKRLWP